MIQKIINRYSNSVKRGLLKKQLNLVQNFFSQFQWEEITLDKDIVAQPLSWMVETFVEPDGNNENNQNLGTNLIISHILFYFTTQCF